MFYDNAVCDGCGQPLHEEDDIVVCPDCGTPQHRACYELNNKCVNEHLHESGFVWENPIALVPEPAAENEYRIDDEHGDFSDPVPTGIPMPALDVNPVFYEKSGIDPETEFDGVKAKDAVSYTQIGAKRYVKKFIRSKDKKFFLSWNWGAFFFAPAWFFYRKLYKVGIIFFSIIIALDIFFIPQQEKLARAFEPTQTLYAEYTEALKNYTENENEENKAALIKVQNEMQKQTRKLAPATAAVFLGTYLIPSIVAALIANGLYKRKMLEDINFAYKSTKDPKILKYSLLRRGGVAFLPAAAVLLLESYLPSMILQFVNSIFS